MNIKNLGRLVLVSLVIAGAPVPAVAATDQVKEYLTNFFDRNEEAASYAKYCLKTNDPAVTAQFDTNINIVAQALLNRLVDANATVPAAAVKQQLQKRQADKRFEGELMFMQKGCGHAGAEHVQAHYQAVSELTPQQMQDRVYKPQSIKTP